MDNTQSRNTKKVFLLVISYKRALFAQMTFFDQLLSGRCLQCHEQVLIRVNLR